MRTLRAVKIANAMLPDTTKLLHFPIFMNYVNIVNHISCFISFVVHLYCYICNTGLVQLYIWFKCFTATCYHHQRSIFLWNVVTLLPTYKCHISENSDFFFVSSL